MNQLQTTAPISISNGMSSLSAPSSPLTTFSSTMSTLNKSILGYGQGGNISTPTNSTVVPSITLGGSIVPFTANVTSSFESSTTASTLDMTTSFNQIVSNTLDPHSISSNVTNVQAAILAASRLIAIPAVSIPTTPLLSLPSLLATTAPSSVTVGNGHTTYLNPNLISELLLAGGNLKGANSSIEEQLNTGIIHHELPENTTIYPVSDSSKSIASNIVGHPDDASLANSTLRNTSSNNNLNLTSLLPNSGTTTIAGNMQYGLLGVQSTVPATNTTSSPITIPSTKSVQTTHQTVKDGILPDSTIAELSAATGLPSADIAAWAAKLPSGSTVKVTRHFDTTLAAVKNNIPSSSSIGSPRPTNLFPIKLPDNISITPTQALLPPPPKLVPAPSKSLSTMSSLSNLLIPAGTTTHMPFSTTESITALPQYIFPKNSNNGLLTEYLSNLRSTSVPSSATGCLPCSTSLPASYYQQNQSCLSIPSCLSSDTSYSSSLLIPSSNQTVVTSNTNDAIYQGDKDIKEDVDNYRDNELLTSGSICLGLPSYQESFAVDPNEILSKNCHNSSPHVSSTLNSIVPQIIDPLRIDLGSRKRHQTQMGILHEPKIKAQELADSFHDLNSNTINSNVDFMNDEAELDPSTLMSMDDEGNILQKFESSRSDELLK